MVNPRAFFTCAQVSKANGVTEVTPFAEAQGLCPACGYRSAAARYGVVRRLSSCLCEGFQLLLDDLVFLGVAKLGLGEEVKRQLQGGLGLLGLAVLDTGAGDVVKCGADLGAAG